MIAPFPLVVVFHLEKTSTKDYLEFIIHQINALRRGENENWRRFPAPDGGGYYHLEMVSPSSWLRDIASREAEKLLNREESIHALFLKPPSKKPVQGRTELDVIQLVIRTTNEKAGALTVTANCSNALFVDAFSRLLRETAATFDELERTKVELVKFYQKALESIVSRDEDQEWQILAGAVNRDESKTEPSAKKGSGKDLGTQGGTLGRVQSAYDLIQSGVPKTRACKRAHIDPRTYDRYIPEFDIV